METFGILNLLKSVLEKGQETSSSPTAEEEKTPPIEPVEKEHNAFLELMEKHDKISRQIKRK